MLLSLYLTTLGVLEYIVRFCAPMLGYLTVFLLGLYVGRHRRHGRGRGWL